MKYSFRNIFESKSPGYLLKIFVFFSIFSLIIILLFVNFGIREVYLKQSIHDAEQNAIGVSTVIFKHDISKLITLDNEGGKTLKISPDRFPYFDKKMLFYLHPLNILKIKVFSKDRKIIYSTDHSIIGQTDINNIKLERSFKGDVISELRKREEVWDLEGEKKYDRDIVETYIPARDESDEIVGSFEIYLDITQYREDVRKALQLSMVVFSTTLLLAFGFLFLIMRRGTKEMDKNQAQLQYQALHDQLTNLPNRVNFLSYLGRILKRSQQDSDYMFAVLLIGLDRFKVINDSLGHLIGDKLLIEVAYRLEESTRPTDRISIFAENNRVSRLGGDEFAVLLNDTRDISSASRVADRVQIELQKPFNVDGHELYTSASIGIALSATGYENAEDILRDANTAMNLANNTGKAHAEIFDNNMRISVSKILKLESDMRNAVKKNQFMLYYQPIVSTLNGKIIGAEALIRWNHPEQGIIMPSDFIPIAEDTGLIIEIGKWVLKTACVQNKEWHDKGYNNLLMNINVSSKQLIDENFIEMIKDVIRETNVPARLIDIELTESIAMEKNITKILTQLNALGTQIVIDDFGTGYSSFSYLIEFPIHTIKLDWSIVQNIEYSDTAVSIIKSIIAMAHSINIESIAEGVETEDQLEFLRSANCDNCQGYLFSRPVPEEEFLKLLEQNNIAPFPINNPKDN